MTMEDIVGRLLNPVVLATLVVAGMVMGRVLWALDLHPTARLWAVAVVPGTIFMAVIWTIRAAQGVVAGTYIALLIDWLLFAHAAVLTVIVRRRMDKP